VTIQEILETHPQPASRDRDVVVRCIEACIDCAATCTSCADADLGESDLPRESDTLAADRRVGRGVRPSLPGKGTARRPSEDACSSFKG
jgi:hypothetical protein